jgi:hypothetical protein
MLLKELADLSILKTENKYRIIPSIKMALFKIISGTHSIKMINSLEGLVHMLQWTRNKKINLKRIISKKTQNP